MKKLLLSLTVLFTAFSGFSQTYHRVSSQLLDAITFNGVPGQKVWMEVYSGSSIIKQIEGYSDNTSYGMVIDSIDASIVFDSIVAYTYDCNGNKVRGIGSPKIYNNIYGYEDTIYQPCPMPILAGKATLGHTHSANHYTIDFTDATVKSGFPNTKITRYCYFGDNDSGVVGTNFSHTYPGAGKYYLEYYVQEFDSLAPSGSGYHSKSWFRDTIEVKGCNASYMVDTVNSGNGTAVIYNNSAPLNTNSKFTTSYLWDFGDGDTSSQAFPKHVYAKAGVFGVCLTTTTTEVANPSNVCTSNFCDTLGMDSTGALVYKNSSYTLQVLAPFMGLNNISLQSNFEVYPNPVEGLLKIKLVSDWEEEWRYSIFDINGRLVSSEQVTFSNGVVELNVESLDSGIYLLALQNKEGHASHQKIIKR